MNEYNSVKMLGVLGEHGLVEATNNPADGPQTLHRLPEMEDGSV